MTKKTDKDEAFDKFAEFLERGRNDDKVHTYVAIKCSTDEEHGERLEICHNLIDDQEAFRFLNSVSAQVIFQMMGVTEEQFLALKERLQESEEAAREELDTEVPVTKH